MISKNLILKSTLTGLGFNNYIESVYKYYTLYININTKKTLDPNGHIKEYNNDNELIKDILIWMRKLT